MFNKIIISAILLSAALTGYSATPDLPVTEILGKQYYYHEIKKGESAYGIAREYGWDLDRLISLNPTASHDMKKGTRLYYPVSTDADRNDRAGDSDEGKTVVETDLQPITHKVKRGETVYSISRLYSISPDYIYASNPRSRTGIKAGEELVIPQPSGETTGRYVFYSVKRGDTLYSLAKSHGLTVEELLAANPGVSERNFHAGETVRIPTQPKAPDLRTETIEEETLTSIDSYKVKKNDTWKSISRKTGVDQTLLREANNGKQKPEKNEIINIPLIKSVAVEHTYAYEDPRETTSEGIQEIYDSIHNVAGEGTRISEVNIALLLDEPTSRKDIDFSRGMLLALDEMKNGPVKINFKIVDGRGSREAVTNELDDFNPTVLIATADKTFPAFLADYGELNSIEIVNAFDVRNDLYEDNPSMIQVLTPSAFFNEQAASRIADDFKGAKLLFVGVKDENDAIADLLTEKFPASDIRHISVSSLDEQNFNNEETYLIYATGQKKDEVNEILSALNQIRETSPAATITVIGRPSWITMTEQFRDKFNAAEIVIPARCWFDPESDEGKRFNEEFADFFESSPLRSFPNFAVSGYDIARYFIEAVSANGGDFNREISIDSRGLQTDFDLKRVSNWGGFLNPVAYLVKFRPYGFVEKVAIK